MENTGLQELSPYSRRLIGLFKIHSYNNPLTFIPDDAFTGLERSLTILNIVNSKINKIPSSSLKYLKKLTSLDFSGNQINKIDKNAWKGLENSAEKIVLRHNNIFSIQTGAFTGLSSLKTLDLTGNQLTYLEQDLFKSGVPLLSNLILADNSFFEIPFSSLQYLKNLKRLDVSYNLMTFLHFNNDQLIDKKLSLDELHLEYNSLSSLSSEAFQNFDMINSTYFDGNPITSINVSFFLSIYLSRYTRVDSFEKKS